MNRAMIRSFHLFIPLMAVLSACNLPSSPPVLSAPTVPLPTIALPTPTLSLPGVTLAPPPAATQVVPTLAPIPTATPVNQNATPTYIGQHQIRADETISCIARAYGVLPSAILQSNNITNVDALVVGQVLNIPAVQWTDIPAGQVCQTQFISPFPSGPSAIANSSPTPLPIHYQDLSRELYLGLGGGGPSGPDCVAMFEGSPPAATPAISGIWRTGSFGAATGIICLFGFPVDQVLTVSLLDRLGGNALYVSFFMVRENDLLQINSSGQILHRVGFVDQIASTSVITLFFWPDPQVKSVTITATNLVLESNLSSVPGVMADFADKSQPAFDPFGQVDTCPDFSPGGEIHLYGFGFEGTPSVTTKIFSTKADLDSDHVDAVNQTNDNSVTGAETLLVTDRLLSSYTITPNPDGSFQFTLRTDPLSQSGLYLVEYEATSPRSCFTLTNRQLVYADRLPAPPVIDGDTRDWATLMDLLDRPTYGFENWAGLSDLSGWFSIGWDDTFLYIAASVVDDRYVQSERDDLLYLGDSLELLLGEPLSAPTTFRSTDYQLGYSLGNLQTNLPPAQAYLWYPSNKRGVPPGAVVKGRQKQSGYDMEIAIPWMVLERVPAPGQQFRFVLSISDNDAENTAVQQSLVSSVFGRVLADPISWGMLQLGD